MKEEILRSELSSALCTAYAISCYGFLSAGLFTVINGIVCAAHASLQKVFLILNTI